MNEQTRTAPEQQYPASQPGLNTGDTLAKPEHRVPDPAPVQVPAYTGTSIVAQMTEDVRNLYNRVSTRLHPRARAAEDEGDDTDTDNKPPVEEPVSDADYDQARTDVLLVLARHFVLSTSDQLAHSQVREALALIERYEGQLPGTVDVTATGAAAPISSTSTGTVDDDPTIVQTSADPNAPVADANVRAAEKRDVGGPSSTTLPVPNLGRADVEREESK